MKLIILILFLNFISAHKIDNVPIVLEQPDGTTFNCFASGDQYYQWVHDINGYSIMQNKLDGYLVNSINPEFVSIDKNIIIDRQDYLDRRNRYWENIERRDAPSVGTINNINVFIRFSDEIEFPNSRNFYNKSIN